KTRSAQYPGLNGRIVDVLILHPSRRLHFNDFPWRSWICTSKDVDANQDILVNESCLVEYASSSFNALPSKHDRSFKLGVRHVNQGSALEPRLRFETYLVALSKNCLEAGRSLFCQIGMLHAQIERFRALKARHHFGLT